MQEIYYDIQKIVAVVDDKKNIYENYKIYLVVPNKQKVLDKVKRANKGSNYITKYMTEDNILDALVSGAWIVVTDVELVV